MGSQDFSFLGSLCSLEGCSEDPRDVLKLPVLRVGLAYNLMITIFAYAR